MEVQIIVNRREVLKKVKKFFSPNLTPAYRSQYGSVSPTAIVGPAIVATAVSTVTAVVFCKVMEGKRRV